MIACLRTVGVPPEVRDRYLAWISEGGAVREAHGILAELVLEPSDGDGETVVLTLWPSHEVFDAWIATPDRTGSPPLTSTRPSAISRSPATTWRAATSTTRAWPP